MKHAAALSLVRLSDERLQLEELLSKAEQIAGSSLRVGYVPIDSGLVLSGLFPTVGSEGESLAGFHDSDWEGIVDALEIADLVDMVPHALSGGQAVRAAVAICAAAQPRVWLLDRCFEWLDAGARAQVRAFFAGQLERGVPVTEVANVDRWLLGPDRPTVPSLRKVGPILTSSSDSTPVLVVEGLNVEFPDFNLGPLNFTLKQAECVALRGPNGAGKTTLVRALLGLVERRGDVRFVGRHRGRAAAVLAFQNPDHQLFRASVRREIEEAALRLGAFDSARVKAIVEILGLRGVMEQDPFALPFAMRRLVTIAAALAPELPLAILDEPSAFLNEVEVASVLCAAHHAASRGTAVIVITHDDQFAEAFASRSIYLERGKQIDPNALQ